MPGLAHWSSPSRERSTTASPPPARTAAHAPTGSCATRPRQPGPPHRCNARSTSPSRGDPSPPTSSNPTRSEEHTSELQSRVDLVCRLLLEKKKKKHKTQMHDKVKQEDVK